VLRAFHTNTLVVSGHDFSRALRFLLDSEWAFKGGEAEKKKKQVPPLRCAPVGMTILLQGSRLFVEVWGSRHKRSCHPSECAWEPRKAGPSTALRFGRDDNSVARKKAFRRGL